MLHLLDRRTGALVPCPPGRVLRVGRPHADAPPEVACDDPHVSRLHCTVEALPGDALRLVDRSSHGTWLNGQRVAGEATLRAGDELSLGTTYPLAVVIPAGVSAAPAAAPAPDGLPPRIADRYAVVRKVAEGGMGVVWEVRDEREGGARRALKVLKQARAGTTVVERFRREAEVGARLRGHEGVVATLDAGALPGGEMFYVMEFVEGRSLKARIDEGPLGQEEAVRIALAVARAVAHAHAQGVVHRDLKPQNVLLAPDGAVRLTDFGIAKALDDATGLTATGSTMGTPAYMPPEQAVDAKRVGPHSDVYGLGGVLYACLVRRPPIDARGLKLREALLRVVEGKIPPPRELDPSIDPALDAICRIALATAPEARFPDAAAFVRALERWLAGDRTPPPPPVASSAGARAAGPPTDDEEGGSGALVLAGLVAGLFLVVAALAAVVALAR